MNKYDIYSNTTDPKYAIKKIPVLHYKEFVYDENHKKIEDIILGLSSKKEKNKEKTKKWIARVDTLITRISEIKTKKKLIKFDTNYIKPILEIETAHKLNTTIKDKIKELTDAYGAKMSIMPSETKKKRTNKKKKNLTQKDS